MTFTDIRCPKCGKLLYRVAGLGCVIRVVCTRCKCVVQWPSLEAKVRESEHEKVAP